MKNITFVYLSLLLTTFNAGAVTLARYDFTDSLMTSSDLDANTSAGTLTAGITGANGFDQIGTTFQDGEAFETGTTSPAIAAKYTAAGATLDTPRADLGEAIANNRYLSFNLTPGGGQQVTFNTLTLDLGKSSTGADINVSLMSSIGGFTLAASEIDSTKTASGTNATFNLSYNLGELNTVSSDTEFRLYFHTTASTGSHDFSIDNIILDGSSAVPEPSSVMLLSLGGLALLTRRRR